MGNEKQISNILFCHSLNTFSTNLVQVKLNPGMKNVTTVTPSVFFSNYTTDCIAT